MSGFPYYKETTPIATKSYGSGLSLNLGIALLQDDEQERTKRPQLDLLSFTPCPNSSSPFWTKSSSWPGTSQGGENRWCGGIDMNQMPDYDDDAVVSSPNSTVSSFHADNPGSLSSSGNKRDRDTPTLTSENDVERASSRLSDEEEGDNNTRKKLRLSKEQSALLEESFKKHNTLNPKQKVALAKQLNLRPRQVEVWFQNRRARTKLKQTEVDCEFLKRCYENLTEENRRLQKEVQELRALKICSPYLMQMGGASAATLTMCPSCERADTHLHRPLSSWQPLALPLPPNSFQPPLRS